MAMERRSSDYYDANNTWRALAKLVNGGAIMLAINMGSIELIDGIFGRNINSVRDFSDIRIVISIAQPFNYLVSL